ncbi:MAG TPA: HlyD family efflux transporter periplasmic adaptor subunit, partial [Roseiarcus sp.]|nr:HlyD family efflux transporter periplasmic adaptor subunit [Roseiarcus sp.]
MSAESDIVRPAAGLNVGGANAKQHPIGARSVQTILERSFLPGAEKDAVDKAPSATKRFVNAVTTRRFLKIALGIGLVVAFGWAPLRAMLATTSVEAIVNARIETIRAPIEGIVQAPGEKTNWSSTAAPPKLTINNPYADRSRLDELRRDLNTLESQEETLGRQSQLTQTALDTISRQAEKYRAGRLKLIDARLARQTAELQATSAKTSQTTASKQRSDHLQQTGFISGAESDRVQYEWNAATSAEAAAQKRLEETKVEHDAVADGVFIGDSYNDSPSSIQRETELKMKKGELDAQLAGVRTQITHINDQIAEEEVRFKLRSEAAVVLPSIGRVWEMLVGPGEFVNKGQDLMRVLDCSHPIVSANVDERVYNRLEVGSPATFRPLQDGKTYHGTVINLTGAAGAPANFAIAPINLRKSPFYVTIAMDDMDAAGCSIGRTGT